LGLGLGLGLGPTPTPTPLFSHKKLISRFLNDFNIKSFNLN